MRAVLVPLLLAAASTGASAGSDLSANLGVVSEFVFRGIAQSFGAALQGGLDYAPETGPYLGAWGSNTDYPTRDGEHTVRFETDVYGGYVFAPGPWRLDLGFIHYRFPDDAAINTVELTANLAIGPSSLFVAHTREFFGSDEPGSYLAATLEQPVGEQVTASASAGHSRGAGVDTVFGRSYWDYSLSLATAADALGPGRWRLALQGTDLGRDEIDGSESRLLLDWLLELEL